MKLPRDVGGKDLASLLTKYGYEINRQTGSHLRLRSAAGEGVHNLTVPLTDHSRSAP